MFGGPQSATTIQSKGAFNTVQSQNSGLLSQPVISDANQHFATLSNHGSGAVMSAGGVRSTQKQNYNQANYASDYNNNIFRPNTSSGATGGLQNVH